MAYQIKMTGAAGEAPVRPPNAPANVAGWHDRFRRTANRLRSDRRTAPALGLLALAGLGGMWALTHVRGEAQARHALYARYNLVEGNDRGTIGRTAFSRGGSASDRASAPRAEGAGMIGAGRGVGGSWNSQARTGGGWQRLTPDQQQARVAERMTRMAKELDLTTQQQTQMRTLFDSMRQQRQSFAQNGNLPRERRREEFMRMRTDMRVQMSHILSPGQMTRWDALRQQNRQRWQNGGRG